MNKTIDNSGKSRLLRRSLPAALALALLAAGIIFLRRDRGPDAAALTTAVRRGPLTITLTESGSIRNSRSTVISSEVEGSATILYLVPEGTHVEVGDLLVELDSSQLEENLARQLITEMNAEANFIRARENLEVVRNQGESEIAKAELAHRFAQQDLIKFKEGDHPRELQKAEGDINIAREELQRAMDKLEWSERLAEDGYITRTELQADALAAKRARITLALAESAMDLLKNFSYQRTLDQLTSDVEQTRQALERTRIKAASDRIQAETELKTRDSEHRRQKAQREKIEDQIKKCRIISPLSAMVVYATSSRGGRFRTTEPLEEGQQVRERQDLIHLPTGDAMMAEIKIHEASLNKVEAGMPVRVTVDTAPDTVLQGRVDRIAFLPDSQSAWMNPDLKVYNTMIRIESNAGHLRPGMGCRAEIVIAEYPDALYVPVQSVTRLEGQSVVYVPGRRAPEPRPVTIGLDNNIVVRILDGLQEGELVLLAPPLSDTGAGEPTMAEPATSVDQPPPDQSPPAPARPGPPERGERGEREEREAQGQNPERRRAPRRETQP